MASLLADEQVPLPVVRNLRTRGHNLVTAQDAGWSGAADADVLAAATASGRAVLTQDRDYIKLHKTGVAHAGIVWTSDDQDFDALADRIHAALAAHPDLTGLLVRV